MSFELDSNCRLYFETDLLEKEVFDILHYLFGGTFEPPEYYSSPKVILYSDENDDHKYATPEMIRSDFIYFRYIIDVEPGPECQTEVKFIEIVSEILEALWAENISVVTASDFEHLLPHNGRREFHD